MKSILISVFLCFSSANLFSQNLINAHHLQTISRNSLNLIPGVVPEYDVEAYYVLYRTIDGKGDSTVASGLCLVPSTDTCNFFPMISYQHGTIMKKSDVPSRLNGESLVGQLFCSLGNIAVCPDYVGLGDSPGLHPYCHDKSEATATIDLIRAAREFMTDSIFKYDNGQIFLIGYSQGGHATMAVHKYIEENNLMNELNIVASAPCSGPYHMSGAQAEMILDTPDYPSPAYLVYIIFAYNSVYENIFSHPTEVLNYPFDTIVPVYLNGNYSHNELNSMLPDSLYLLLNDSFYVAVLNDMNDKLTPFWQNLLDNDNYNWAPEAPVRMYYCQADEQVSYLNSIHADSAMLALGAVDVQSINVLPSANHGDCGIPAIISAYNWFNTLRIPCNGNASVQISSQNKINIFPNPAQEYIIVTGIISPATVMIFNAEGKLYAQMKCTSSSDFIVDISRLNSGFYLVWYKSENDDNPGVFQKMIISK